MTGELVSTCLQSREALEAWKGQKKSSASTHASLLAWREKVSPILMSDTQGGGKHFRYSYTQGCRVS